ncbi:hypothetical protein T10_11742 [Trichinella papuae]|uniref:Uncharacterized protein n=1 Tax=Trichinella papuae TaxID=268474 RepID=A0A0V1MH54_9BILA|nr:hypothetical protein T10_3309 [Trichinella papuae]KRZ71150.1 hypothetical protein T10_11742 [Trichinella papuae]
MDELLFFVERGNKSQQNVPFFRVLFVSYYFFYLAMAVSLFVEKVSLSVSTFPLTSFSFWKDETFDKKKHYQKP